MNSYFDMVYVVTTERLKNRHEYIKNHLSKFDINFKFIYGPDKKNIDVNDYNVSSDLLNIARFDNDDIQHEIGCLLSHYFSWDDMIDNNYKNCVILEDDCHLHPDFIEKNNKFLKNISKIDWDIIQYGWQPYNYYNRDSIPSYMKMDKINENVFEQWSFIGGAHCYAINRKTAHIFKDNLVLLKKDKQTENINLYGKGIISKSIDGYIGDLSNPWTKQKNNINLKSYRPDECLAFDCSHGNKYTDTKFSIFAKDE